MKVRIAYIDAAQQQFWQQLELPATCTVQDAISASGVLEQFPEIDLEQQKVGIFGKFAKLDDPLSEGDRIEIYRPITADPATVKRRER